MIEEKITVQCGKCQAKFKARKPRQTVQYTCKKCRAPIVIKSGASQVKSTRKKRPQKIAVINHKGGCGKTTTAVNLAAVLQEMGKKVLLIDLDPQASTTKWFKTRKIGRELHDFFIGDVGLNAIVTETNVDGISLIPSSTWMTNIPKRLNSEVGSELVLKNGIKKLNPNQWDYVLIDCPPTRNILTVNALTAVDNVLIPLEAHILSISGLNNLLNTIELVKDRLNRNLTIMGILFCRYDVRTRHARDIEEWVRKKHGRLVYKTLIRENIKLAEAPHYKLPITLYKTSSRGAEDYRAFTKEMINREKRKQKKKTAETAKKVSKK